MLHCSKCAAIQKAGKAGGKFKAAIGSKSRRGSTLQRVAVGHRGHECIFAVTQNDKACVVRARQHQQARRPLCEIDLTFRRSRLRCGPDQPKRIA